LRIAVSLWCAWAPRADALGGHFAVDDATILDVGQCQVETWLERGGSASELLHVGPACRVGPVEIGINADRAQAKSHSPVTFAGPQVKAVAAFADQLDIGVVAVAAWQGQAPHRGAASVYVPLSVRVLPSVRLHANAGRDWVEHGSTTSRAGVALEWQAHDRVALIGEGFRQFGANFARAGVHWEAGAFSVDLSRSFGASTRTSGWWTLGFNFSFDVAARASSDATIRP